MKLFFKRKAKETSKGDSRRVRILLFAFVLILIVSSSVILSEFPWNGNLISWLKAREHYDQGFRLSQRYYLQDAEARLSMAASLYPADWRIQQKYGITLMRRNKTVEAENCFRQALKLDPKNPLLYLDLCDCLLAQNKLIEAEAEARKVVALDPLNSEGFAYLALILHKLNRDDEAKKAFESTRALEKNTGRYWYTCARYHADQNECEQLAESEYRQAAAMERGNPEYWETIGLILYRNGNLQEAEQYLRRATILNAFEPRYWNSLAQVLYDDNEHERAEECYKRVTQLDNKNAEAWLNLATIRLIQKRYSAAEEPFRRAVEISPENQSALGGYFQTLLAQKKLKEAAVVLQEKMLKLPAYEKDVFNWLTSAALDIEIASYDRARNTLAKVRTFELTPDEIKSADAMDKLILEKTKETSSTGNETGKDEPGKDAKTSDVLQRSASPAEKMQAVPTRND